VRYEASSRWQRAAAARKVQVLRSQDGPEAPEADTPIGYLPLYEHAHREHQPGEQRLQGFFAVYRATQGDGSVADRPYREIYGDPMLGWGPRVVQPPEVVDVPGGHSSLLQEPNVHRLAEAMNSHLARALHADAVTPSVAEPSPNGTSSPRLQSAEVDG